MKVKGSNKKIPYNHSICSCCIMVWGYSEENNGHLFFICQQNCYLVTVCQLLILLTNILF